MKDFVYDNSTRMIFGRGTENQVGELMAQLGKKVLLVYGGGSIKRSGLYDRACASLRSAGLEMVELGGVQPNPRLSRVHEGVELCRREGVDCILAVGGGSVMDCAKAIGFGVLYEGDVWDLFDKGMVPNPCLPLGVIVTIPASGSESSHALIITKEEGHHKRAMASLNARPKFAILDPELTYTLPPYQTACGIVDMLCHVMERYLAHMEKADLTDRLCEGIMRSIIYNAGVVMKNPEDYDARGELMWAGTIAHNDFFGVGRDQDWAAHNIEHELSAEYDIAHGAGLAMIFPAWCRFIAPERKKLFVQFAVRVWDVDMWFGDEDAIIEEGICRLERFFKSLDMPTRLSDIGIDSSKFRAMAEHGTVVGFSRPHTPDEIEEIFYLAQ